ncbi:MAG: MCE family protein [Deltaproteobacteria bacterium]|nr:MCE family protein [Deltaproteobacteria bacterium]
MDSKGSHFFIGLFVIFGITGIFATGVWLSRQDSTEKTISYEIHFEESVSGLNIGSWVSYRGIRIGSVIFMGIKPDNPQLVLVRISVQDDHQLRQGDVASLKFGGITGSSYIYIEGATPGSKVIQSSDADPAVIPSHKSEFEQVVQGVPELISQSTVLVQRFANILNQDNQEQLQSILTNVNAISTSLADQNENISGMFVTIQDAATEFKALSISLNQTITKVDTLVTRLNSTVDGVNDLITDDAKHLINEWKITANALKTLTDSANDILAANQDSLQEFSQEGLNEFVHFLQEARVLVAGLSRVVDRIESSGARFLLDQHTPEINPD